MSEPSPNELIGPLPPLRKVIIKKPKPEINSNIKIEDHGANPDKEPIIKNKKTSIKASKLEKLKPNEISFHNYNILNDENEKSSADYKVAELKEMCAIIQRDFDYKKIKVT